MPTAFLQSGANVVAGTAVDRFGVANRAALTLRAFVDNGAPTRTLLPFGSQWRYLDDGSNQGVAWRAVDFDDTSWALGAAELGHGDGDEATRVGLGDGATKPVTTYFRTTFEIGDPGDYFTLRLDLRRDDGAAVYLNGEEAARSNLAAGAAFDALASGNATDDGNAVFTFDVPSTLLVAGRNVLAVEVHQVVRTSSDLSFDLRIRGAHRSDDVTVGVPPLTCDFDGLPRGTTFAPSRDGALGFRTFGCLTGLARGVTRDGEYSVYDPSGTVQILFDEVDLRTSYAVRVGVGARAWETSSTSDFEGNDFIRAAVDLFDGDRLVDTVTIFDVRGGDPDALSGLDRGGVRGPLTMFDVVLPPGHDSARLRVEARTDSNTERLFFDAVSFESLPPPFLRGDVDERPLIGIGDALRIFSLLFLVDDESFDCDDAADVDDDGTIRITDGIFLLNWLFVGGPDPAEPFPECGDDVTDDALDCARSTRCTE